MTRAEITRYGIPSNQLERCRQQRNTKALVTFAGRYKNGSPFLVEEREDDEEDGSDEFLDQFVIPMDNCLIRIFNSFIIMLQVFASLAYVYLAAFRMNDL